MPMKYKKYVCLFEKPFKVTEYGIFLKIFFLVYFMQDSFSHIVRLDELVRRHEVHVTGVSSMHVSRRIAAVHLSLTPHLVKSGDTCIWYRSFKKKMPFLLTLKGL